MDGGKKANSPSVLVAECGRGVVGVRPPPDECKGMCMEACPPPLPLLPNWKGLLDERLIKGLGLTGVSAGDMDR